jgi:hypothetical protein
VARDNPENESAFNCDPFEDPPEVSIHTLDMRNIFRETSFIPGDRFVVRSRDWKKGHFDLEKVEKDFSAGLITNYAEAFSQVNNAVSAQINHLEYIFLFNQTALELEYYTQ